MYNNKSAERKKNLVSPLYANCVAEYCRYKTPPRLTRLGYMDFGEMRGDAADEKKQMAFFINEMLLKKLKKGSLRCLGPFGLHV